MRKYRPIIRLQRNTIFVNILLKNEEGKPIELTDQERDTVCDIEEVIDAFEDNIVVQFEGLKPLQNLGKVESKIFQVLSEILIREKTNDT